MRACGRKRKNRERNSTVKQRNWLDNIKFDVDEAMAKHMTQVVVIQMSEPLRDLIVTQLIREVHVELEDQSGMRDGVMRLWNCEVMVTNTIPTYRIFVEA